MTVEELLVERRVHFKQSPADFIVGCLNPEHDDSNPSMRIDRITGIYTNFHSSLYRPLYFESTDNRKYDIPLQQQIKVDLKKLNIL